MEAQPDLLLRFQYITGCDVSRMGSYLLVLSCGLLVGCATVPVAPAHDDGELAKVVQQLAHLEVSSNHLSMAIADQADVAGYSHQLALLSDLPGPFTTVDMERIERSFRNTLNVMLFELAPAQFWETHLAAYYAARLSVSKAQMLVEGYEREALLPSSRLVELRRSFLAERLPELLPDVRARSHPFQIPNEAMVPSLLPGDHVIVHRAAYTSAGPQRGDIVVYRYPDETGKLFMHRVVGLPGDQVQISDQLVMINGAPLDELSVQHTDRSMMAGNVRDYLGPIAVPSDAYFVMGDNREESLDSRFLGSIQKEQLLGQVVFVYWSVDPSNRAPRWERLNQPVRR